ncbi:MAG TPA: sigma-70 family RNA polymerase sigma factor [Chitinophagales bacterium]|nr:sigma-70 family RNA polymerase sigma factor [Chitinophagales bacterium]
MLIRHTSMTTMLSLNMAKENEVSIRNTISQYGKRLFGYIRSKVKTNEDAEDILQDVWYQLSNFGNLSEIENLSAWLYRVAGNKVTDAYRKKSNDLLDDFVIEDEDGSFDFKEILLLDDSKNPDMVFFKELFWDELIRALDELPEKQREVFVLNEIQDMTLQEIADQSGENLKTIISRKGYAVKHLRERLHYLYLELKNN